MKKIVFALLSFLMNFSMNAQEAVSQPEMATGLYASGKIYVVVTVCLIILSGLFFYLINLDRKISSIEKKIGTEKK